MPLGPPVSVTCFDIPCGWCIWGARFPVFAPRTVVVSVFNSSLAQPQGLLNEIPGGKSPLHFLNKDNNYGNCITLAFLACVYEQMVWANESSSFFPSNQVVLWNSRVDRIRLFVCCFLLHLFSGALHNHHNSSPLLSLLWQCFPFPPLQSC